MTTPIIIIIIVAAWFAETCRSLFLSPVHRSIGHAFNEINEVWQQVSRRQVVRSGRNVALS